MKAYRFRIELVDSNPLIWRTFVIPAGVTFKRLHDTIQYVMGWWNSHLHAFVLTEPALRITNDEEGYFDQLSMIEEKKQGLLDEIVDPHGILLRSLETPMKLSKSLKIDKYVEKNPVFTYLYDFGDGWEHRITLEKIDEEYKYPYPKILEGEGDCPPEDVGGIGGYEEFLIIMLDRKNPAYLEMKDWAEMQNYSKFRIKDVNDWMRHDLRLKRI
ncbi:MAG TPA: plasmid pRiA4b ORF-3 family protein [Erysipelotrichaceae bacterium]|nr:plasmid pRiA4b ORF-3 family protein [Erysipelotrichaceae bacterium]